MTDNTTSKVLTVSGSANLGKSYIQFFHQGKSQLMLSNCEDDKVIIPYDLLPDYKQDGGLMINLVEAVKHLVKTIRTLEAENAELKKHSEWLEGNLDLKNIVIADLKNQLREAMEKY